MKEIKTFENKKVLVLGLAKSGVNAARLLHRLGALVTVNDRKAFEDNKDAQSLLADGIRVITGKHPLELLDENFELMVKNPGIPYTNPMVQRAQTLHIPIITEPELAFEVSSAPWIGITGTNGKTTTTTLIGAMLNQAKPGSALDAGNIGIPLSQVVQKATAQQTIVAELSSFQLAGVTTLHPHIAVLTNIYEAHLDWHGDRAHYVADKMHITRNQTPDDFFVMNWDQPEMHTLAEQSHAQIVPFSRQNTAGARAILDGEGWLRFDDEPIILASALKIPGVHNIENALAAIAAAKLAGVSTDAIRAVLATFSGVKHRIQYVATIAQRDFYNDSKATNVEAASVALQAFERPIIWLAGGLDRGLPMDDLIPLVKAHVKAMVVFGETAAQMAAVAQAAEVPVVKTSDVVTATTIAYDESQVGDVILLSPAAASWDQFPNFEIRGDVFIDAVKALQQKAESEDN